ncbi:MAG: hypothetical protein A2X36_04040 [Elusimicrobia bacterium GWA2_69_24]|nr:MAG: hypothetical protein A2X36_04040 [Elusimicrobia bacterium GWA2_69_24]HBL16051.1 hypothetical protein [Elusimicrobiota bacterium]
MNAHSLAIAALAAVVAAAAVLAAPKTLGPVLDEIGVSAPAWREAAVIKSVRREGRQHLFWTVVARTGARTLRLEITTRVGPEAAQRLQDDWGIRIRSLFRPATTDYFGVTQRRVVVPEELHPAVRYPRKTLLRSGDPVFVLWSDRDLGYLVKSRETAVNRGVSWFRYCGKRQVLLQVETFAPGAGFDEAAALAESSSVSCSD